MTLDPVPSVHLAIAVRCAEYPSFSPDGTQIAFDAPAEDALGGQTAIMAANTDGTDIRTLSTVPFRQSVHPDLAAGLTVRKRRRGGRLRLPAATRSRCILG